MLKIVQSNSFKKDLELAKKRGFDLSILLKVINMLANKEPLPLIFKDHSLNDEYSNFRECHIKPNWLLIYYIDDEELELFLFRTGNHSDLF